MVLPDIEQLERLIKMLRSNGVMQYQSTDLNLVMSEKAPDLSESRIVKSLAEETMEDLSPEEEIERLIGYSDIPTAQPGFFEPKE